LSWQDLAQWVDQDPASLLAAASPLP